MNKSNELQVLRHSAAHLLAHAVLELFPDTQLTIGPATETGFFYDCLPTRNFKEEDLPIIEKRMHEISQRNLALSHKQISKDQARALYKNNTFKLELIDGLEGETAGISEQGTFYDLCRGGHVASTGDIKYFKLTTISGSYWRADRNGTALQRISGIAFLTQEDMDAYLQHQEDLIKYDHRRLGKQLDLFSFHEEGVGFPFFHPKGKCVLNIMATYMRSILKKADYQEIETPIMLSDELWRCSGHYDFYKKNMYFSEIDDKNYAVKPMNCPGSILLFKERPRSYRELPMRLNEFGRVHRHELSGVLHGLFRVRTFTIDDTHIYCTYDQIEQEILTNIKIFRTVQKTFGFDDVKIDLATRPEKSMGSDELWGKAINGLKNALDKAGIPYTVQEGDGAFYGPKLDFKIKDSMGREWTCGTIQIDFLMPENFDLHYVAPGGELKRPAIIHQAIYGSLERFFGVLLEHYKGILPFWLAPVQILILTITDDQKVYAQQLMEELKLSGMRVEMDHTSDTISGKIKSAQLQKVPWMLVIGKKEVENNTVTLRFFDGSQKPGITKNDVISLATTLIPSY